MDGSQTWGLTGPRCELKFRGERLKRIPPAFSQFDKCPACLAFLELNTGIALPTANITKELA